MIRNAVVLERPVVKKKSSLLSLVGQPYDDHASIRGTPILKYGIGPSSFQGSYMRWGSYGRGQPEIVAELFKVIRKGKNHPSRDVLEALGTNARGIARARSTALLMDYPFRRKIVELPRGHEPYDTTLSLLDTAGL
uniref:Uncharacterized protein n=1 Tax=Cannabis sativa TaxID=3483 RepID=A0A803QGN5_CANSA